MLSVAGIWLYMFFTTFLAGYGIVQALTRYIPYRVRHKDTYLLCGLAAVTVYAQFFSLFGRVGLAANLMLALACLWVLWRYRRELRDMLLEMWDNIQGGRSGLIMLFLFLLFAYGTSRGIIHYDTSLYHAQSIRWLEEYGVVKGLGNLHCRLAYDSSSFALSALYSMSFLGGQSYHCAAGWLAFLLAKICLEIVDSLRAGRLRVSGFVRGMGIYYLVIIFDEMISPASDYFMVLLAFYIVIRWLDLLEEGVREIFPYAMLCVMCVFLMTIKLSAALIILLTLYPAYHLLKNQCWKETTLYLALGILTAVPFFIRNVLLSGWLVYPFTRFDLFDVAWKIPKGVADYDAREIQVWGRGYSDVTRYDISMKEWLPEWFHSLAGSDRLLVIAAAVAVGILAVYAAGMGLGLWRRRWDMLLVQVTMAGSFVFWLCTSPLIRYGCVYVYLTPAVIFGGIYDAFLCVEDEDTSIESTLWGRIKSRVVRSSHGIICARVSQNIRVKDGMRHKLGEGWRKAVRRCGTITVVFLIVYKCVALGREIVSAYVNDYWLVQKDYENYETASYEIEGITFYYPINGDQVGYEDFPSAPVKADIKFLGTGIEDGFADGDGS